MAVPVVRKLLTGLNNFVDDFEDRYAKWNASRHRLKRITVDFVKKHRSMDANVKTL